MIIGRRLKRTTIFGFLALIIMTFAIDLSACSLDRWVQINEGDYIPIELSVLHETTGAYLIEIMSVDRNDNT